MDAMIRCTKYLLITALVFLQITNSFVSKAQKLFFTSTIVNRVAVNEKYTYSVAVKDASQKKIQFSCNNLPSWLSFDTKNNILSGIAKNTGQYDIQITALNGDTTLHQNFMLTVFNKQTVNILTLGNSLTNGTNV